MVRELNGSLIAFWLDATDVVALLDATVGSVDPMHRDKPEAMKAAKVSISPAFSRHYHDLRKHPESITNR